VFCAAPAQRPQRGVVLAMLLLNPALLLIDHGHFQYNGISLGLSLGAAAAIAAGWEIAGSVMFCLALNHKQMALYYAPAFFGHLLGRCLQRPTLAGKVGLGASPLGRRRLGCHRPCHLTRSPAATACRQSPFPPWVSPSWRHLACCGPPT
jgi:alpha-1,3-glucosyltransferase